MFDERGTRRIAQRPDRTSVFAQYTILVEERAAVAARLDELGVPTAVHYPAPLDAQPAYREVCVSGSLPVSNELASSVLSLPMHAYLDEKDQDRIVDAVHLALGSNH